MQKPANVKGIPMKLSCLLVLAIICSNACRKTLAWSTAADVPTIKDKLIFFERPYKFDGKFAAYRLGALLDIVDNGGSVQSNDALEYGEFVAIKRDPSVLPLLLHSKEQLMIVTKFDDAQKLLRKQLSQFVARQPLLVKEKENAWAKTLEEWKKKLEAEGRRTLTQKIRTSEEELNMGKEKFPLHQLVLDCKQFMRELHTDGNVEIATKENEYISADGAIGSFLDVHSFMKEPEYAALRTIYQLSTIQTAQLDMLMLKRMLKEHF